MFFQCGLTFILFELLKEIRGNWWKSWENRENGGKLGKPGKWWKAGKTEKMVESWENRKNGGKPGKLEKLKVREIW